MVKHILNTYKDFHPPKHYSETGLWADPYVIALAKIKNATVITQESPSNSGKIPYVCYEMGIPCMNLDKLMLSNKWQF